ncbi:MAG: 4-alpha-glucanotransferase [Opitutales bacterium]|nr:4-alpha-glucanotransferase [Opitutales bacterium]
MALFNWLKNRSAGVLLHPTALPSDQGIGCFGKGAYRFVDVLSEMRVRYWQVCPLGPTGYGNSPYQCYSSFAGNPSMIDLESLGGNLEIFKNLNRAKVDFDRFAPLHAAELDRIIETFLNNKSALDKWGDFEKFKRDNQYWLHGYALYMALKEENGGNAWYEWPDEFKNFKNAVKKTFPPNIRKSVEKIEIIQFLFFAQWQELRHYARQRGIEIIGDAPIFTALDSADVWQNPEIFQLDKKQKPLAVAGVPPDYFSATGQRWGNPLYDWKALKKQKYAWWIERLRACFKLYDVVRIDHFRAFCDYWRIPADSPDARNGEWIKGPGLEFFETVRKSLGEARLIAEDLGDLNDDVRKLLADTGLPGMNVLIFAFGGDPKNLYLPHNIKSNSIVYPGTHDNDTVAGWYARAPEHEKDFFRRYLWTDGNAPHCAMINAALKSHAKMAIVAAQDILGLGSEARFNEPGTSEGNWCWRLRDEELQELKTLAGTLVRPLVEISGRC